MSNSLSSLPLAPNVTAKPADSGLIKYFINDDIVKHKLHVEPGTTVQKFSQLVRDYNKLSSSDFAVFVFDSVENRLRILKDSNVINGNEIYFVIENSKLDAIYRKLERKVKKGMCLFLALICELVSNLMHTTQIKVWLLALVGDLYGPLITIPSRWTSYRKMPF